MFGVDASAEAVELARAATSGSFSVAHVPPLPFTDDSFDGVVSFETIEHVEKDSEFVAEVRRVLKPDSPLLISTPNRALGGTEGRGEVPSPLPAGKALGSTSPRRRNR